MLGFICGNQSHILLVNEENNTIHNLISQGCYSTLSTFFILFSNGNFYIHAANGLRYDIMILEMNAPSP